MGRTFNRVLRAAALTGFADTQCGFKGFRAAAARDLFGRATIDGFAFDVEILLLAQARYRVEEIGIVWHNAPDSRVGMLADSWRMLRDVMALRLRAARGGRRRSTR